MLKTLTVWSNGTKEINTGANFLKFDGVAFTDALEEKMSAIGSTIAAAGISQLHAEKDTSRQFEHLLLGGEVLANEFGTTLSLDDFDWIMHHVDAEIAAQEAEAEADEATPE